MAHASGLRLDAALLLDAPGIVQPLAGRAEFGQGVTLAGFGAGLFGLSPLQQGLRVAQAHFCLLARLAGQLGALGGFVGKTAGAVVVHLSGKQVVVDGLGAGCAGKQGGAEQQHTQEGGHRVILGRVAIGR